MGKERKQRNSNLIDTEADEEEEDNIMGLEDFGFSVPKKDTDEEKIVVEKEDLEGIVDEVSDNEGDEVEGGKKRKEMEIQDEKERHKEIIRRMRDGYDGRRGGVAGGRGMRGVHRFDQLVAADNRKDAKKLGLLNDDELESEEEKEEGNNDEEDDEAAELDKILKERFLQNAQLKEAFSDESDNEGDNTPELSDALEREDEDELEEQRIAKRFTKRARMNRVLEQHGSDQVSQPCITEQDEHSMLDLKSIKTLNPLRRNVSQTSSVFSGNDSNSQGSAFPSKGKLSITLRIGRSSKKRTSFLSGRKSRGAGALARSVSLSHVVFQTGEGNGSHPSKSRSDLSLSEPKQSVDFKEMSFTNNSRQKDVSLWSKISANRFRER